MYAYIVSESADSPAQGRYPYIVLRKLLFMVKKPVVGENLPDPPDKERLRPMFVVRPLGNGYWVVESEQGPVMTEAGDGLCSHELSQLLTQGTVTQCHTCGVDV